MAAPDFALTLALQYLSTSKALGNAFDDLNADVDVGGDASSAEEQTNPMIPANSALLLVSRMNSFSEAYMF